MKVIKGFLKISTVLIISAFIAGCIEPDYFTMYSGKNLIGHVSLSDWNTSQDGTYMTYEAVAAATAGTSGLPDTSAAIYRLEINNLVPFGDFEGAATLAAAGWDDTNGGIDSITAVDHNLDGNAISFDLSNSNYLEYDLNQLADTAIAGSLYMYRYSLQGSTGEYKFEIEDTTVTNNLTPYSPNIPASGVDNHLEVPKDFNNHPTTEFFIHSSDTEVFRINSAASGITKAGFFDNFRVIRTDQPQFIILNIPFDSTNRIDELPLISGSYRFSVYVKADPELSTRSNSFKAVGATLKIQSFDPDGTGGTITENSFKSSELSSFAEWTYISLDSQIQINTPSNTSQTAIQVSICPTDTLGGAVTMDAGSLLISNPSLLFSENGIF